MAPLDDSVMAEVPGQTGPVEGDLDAAATVMGATTLDETSRSPDDLVDDAEEVPPQPTLEEHLLADDRTLTGSPHATATNAALRALARAARSFLIYDSHNEAIRQFLRDYQEATRAALKLGPLELEVRPFELVLVSDLGEEVVYLQRERDKSLAFRLYRDGVRRVNIHPDVEWGELLRLLEILSIRYTGVRQHEDDIVTLLWKAGFKHIEAVSVEGFVLASDEEDEEGSSEAARELRRAGPRVEVPPDFDRPFPEHPGGDFNQVRYRVIAPKVLDACQYAVSSLVVGKLAVQLCADMLELVRDPIDPTSLADVAGLVDEVRSLLQADGQLDKLLALARAVADLRSFDEESAQAALLRFVDARALGRILHSAARGEGSLPPELVTLLDLVPGDHLPSLVTAMGTERGSGSRALARQLIGREVERRPDSVVALISAVDSEIAADLLRSLSEVAPARAVEAASLVVGLRDSPLQAELHHLVETLSDELLPGQMLLQWLGSPDESTRLKVLARLGKVGDSTTYVALQRQLAALSGRAREESIAVGIAMAQVAPERALSEFGNIVRPRSFLGRMSGGALTGIQVWAGVSGLGMLPGNYCETAIRWRMERCGEDLYKHCQRTLFERRQRGFHVGSDRLAEGSVLYHRSIWSYPGLLVLTPQMLCFSPSRSVDRWIGASQLDLPLRNLDSVDIDDRNASLVVHGGSDSWRFTGDAAGKVGAALMAALSGGGHGVRGSTE